MNEYALLLTARPTAIGGAARLIDIGGTLTQFNTALSENQADYLATLADWRAVGDDLRRAVAEYEAAQSSNQNA